MNQSFRILAQFGFFISFFLLLGNAVLAQPGFKFSTNNKKAIAAYNEAYNHMRIRNTEEALSCLEKAISKDGAFVEAWMLKGQIYFEAKEYAASIDPFEKAISIDPAFFPLNYLALAEAYHLTGQYAQARKQLDAFDTFGITEGDVPAQARLLRESSHFAENAKANPVLFEPKNVGQGINTASDEYFPCITADDGTILFTRLLTSQQFGMQEDFFISQQRAQKWEEALPMQRINTEGNEGAPTLSSDGRVLIFTACEVTDGLYMGDREGAGSCDLFYSERVGQQWSQPQNLGAKINTGYWESQPSYSADGRTLYFVQGKAGRGGKKEMDIYTARLGLDGNWGKPRKLSDVINTPFQEESVLIHPDGQTLYFSSNGHPGMGGADIFMSRKDADGNWQKPINLGYPINTADDENSIMINAQGNMAYFASDRAGGFGGLDIYGFELPEDVRPNAVSYAIGNVFDDETKKPLGAYIELIDLETKKTVIRSASDQLSGEFLVCLPTGREYALNVSREGYLFYSDNFNLTGTARDAVELQVPLKPYRKGETVVLRNVFFDSDSYALKPASIVELDKLARLLKSNEELSIVINGHTDDVGDDASNLTLSQNRAASVVAYLQKKGIASERLSAKGYGETKPLVANDSETNRAINRRTEFEVK